MKSGIYLIRNKFNHKVYVGSSSRLNRRWNIHKHHLRLGTHHSPYLQNSWRKYGQKSFNFVTIEWVPINKLLAREQYWMDLYESYNRRYGYNVSPTASSNRGIRKTASQILHLSEINKKLARSPKVLARLKQIAKLAKFAWKDGRPMGMLGKKQSASAKDKIRLSRLGYKQTSEHIRNAANARRGTKWTVEQRIQHSKVQKLRFKKNPVSRETCNKLSLIVKDIWKKRKTNVAFANSSIDDKSRSPF